MMYFVAYAHRKTVAQVTDAITADDVDTILALPDIHGHWQRVHDYARLLRQAFVEYPAQVARRRGKQPEEVWAGQRIASRELNLKRYEVCSLVFEYLDVR
jgi:hypothetical protein